MIIRYLNYLLKYCYLLIRYLNNVFIYLHLYIWFCWIRMISSKLLYILGADEVYLWLFLRTFCRKMVQFLFSFYSHQKCSVLIKYICFEIGVTGIIIKIIAVFIPIKLVTSFTNWYLHTWMKFGNNNLRI